MFSYHRRRPRILYFTPFWPDRPSSAAELRAFHVACALREVGDVEMIVVDADGDDGGWDRAVSRRFNVECSVKVRSYPNRSLRQKVEWALNPRTFYPHGCGVDQQSMEQVGRLASQYDLLWFYKLRTANMFPRWAWSRSVADVDDVPSAYARSIWRFENGWRNRTVNGVRVVSWRRRDKLLGHRFSVLGVCSEEDRCYLRSLGVKGPLHVIPNGYRKPTVALARNLATPPRIGFIGILDYAANRQGIEWFASRCWPDLKRTIPDARLRLVGRYSDGPLRPAGQDIDGLGWVEHPEEEMATWSAMVVPIHVGGGTRGKIAHAFSVRCPVVSTPYGAYGYEVEDEREVLLAQSAGEFVNACVRAIKRPHEMTVMAELAWLKFMRRWTWDAVSPRIWAAAEDCLGRCAGMHGSTYRGY